MSSRTRGASPLRPRAGEGGVASSGLSQRYGAHDAGRSVLSRVHALSRCPAVDATVLRKHEKRSRVRCPWRWGLAGEVRNGAPAPLPPDLVRHRLNCGSHGSGTQALLTLCCLPAPCAARSGTTLRRGSTRCAPSATTCYELVVIVDLWWLLAIVSLLDPEPCPLPLCGARE